MKHSKAISGLFVAIGLVILTAAGCGGGSGGGVFGGGTTPTSVVSSIDGNATINVPTSGSVTPSSVTIAPAVSPPASSVLVAGTAYTASSTSGTSFGGINVGSVTIKFNPSNLPGPIAMCNIVIGTLNNSNVWVPVVGTTAVNVSNNSATVSVTSVGTYGVLAANVSGAYTLGQIGFPATGATANCPGTLSITGASDSCAVNVYTFASNGTFTVTVSNVTAATGTWSMNGSTLTTIYTKTGASTSITDTYQAVLATPVLTLLRTGTTDNINSTIIGESLIFAKTG